MIELESFKACLLGEIFPVCSADRCWTELLNIIVKLDKEDIFFFIFIEFKFLLKLVREVVLIKPIVQLAFKHFSYIHGVSDLDQTFRFTVKFYAVRR